MARITPPLRLTRNREVASSEENRAMPHSVKIRVNSQATPAGRNSSARRSSRPRLAMASEPRSTPRLLPSSSWVCRALKITSREVVTRLALSMVNRSRSAPVGAKKEEADCTGIRHSASTEAWRRGRKNCTWPKVALDAANSRTRVQPTRRR